MFPIAFVYGKTKLHVFGVFPILSSPFWVSKIFVIKKCQKNATFKDGNSLTLITNLNNVCFYPYWECTKINYKMRVA